MSIRRDHDVGDEVVVASEGTTSKAVVAILTGKSPADDGLITRCGKDHVGVLGRGGNGGDPSTVSE